MNDKLIESLIHLRMNNDIFDQILVYMYKTLFNCVVIFFITFHIEGMCVTRRLSEGRCRGRCSPPRPPLAAWERMCFRNFQAGPAQPVSSPRETWMLCLDHQFISVWWKYQWIVQSTSASETNHYLWWPVSDTGARCPCLCAGSSTWCSYSVPCATS